MNMLPTAPGRADLLIDQLRANRTETIAGYLKAGDSKSWIKLEYVPSGKGSRLVFRRDTRGMNPLERALYFLYDHMALSDVAKVQAELESHRQTSDQLHLDLASRFADLENADERNGTRHAIPVVITIQGKETSADLLASGRSVAKALSVMENEISRKQLVGARLVSTAEHAVLALTYRHGGTDLRVEIRGEHDELDRLRAMAEHPAAFFARPYRTAGELVGSFQAARREELAMERLEAIAEGYLPMSRDVREGQCRYVATGDGKQLAPATRRARKAALDKCRAGVRKQVRAEFWSLVSAVDRWSRPVLPIAGELAKVHLEKIEKNAALLTMTHSAAEFATELDADMYSDAAKQLKDAHSLNIGNTVAYTKEGVGKYTAFMKLRTDRSASTDECPEELVRVTFARRLNPRDVVLRQVMPGSAMRADASASACAQPVAPRAEPGMQPAQANAHAAPLPKLLSQEEEEFIRAWARLTGAPLERSVARAMSQIAVVEAMEAAEPPDEGAASPETTPGAPGRSAMPFVRHAGVSEERQQQLLRAIDLSARGPQLDASREEELRARKEALEQQTVNLQIAREMCRVKAEAARHAAVASSAEPARANPINLDLRPNTLQRQLQVDTYCLELKKNPAPLRLIGWEGPEYASFGVMLKSLDYRGVAGLAALLHNTVHDNYLHDKVYDNVRWDIDQSMDHACFRVIDHGNADADAETFSARRALARHDLFTRRITALTARKATFDVPEHAPARGDVVALRAYESAKSELLYLDLRIKSYEANLRELGNVHTLRGMMSDDMRRTHVGCLIQAEGDLRRAFDQVKVGKTTFGELNAWRMNEIASVRQ